MGSILSWAAFDGLKATAAEQTAEAIAVIKGFYLYVPIAIWLLMFLIALCYRLDKKYDQMMRELIAREGKADAEAPELADDLDSAQHGGLAGESGKYSNQINIAIGRLYGASGRKIAEALAKELKCRVYDRQIICMLGERFGMESASIENLQKYLDSYNEGETLTFSPYSMPGAGVAEDVVDTRVFEEQSRLILKLAKKEPGIFLGRCANFVLAKLPHTYSFFIYADDDYREKEGQEYYQGQTLAELKERDEKRNEYYLRYTGTKRNDPKCYDMVVNVGKTGVEGAVQMILDYVRKKEQQI